VGLAHLRRERPGLRFDRPAASTCPRRDSWIRYVSFAALWSDVQRHRHLLRPPPPPPPLLWMFPGATSLISSATTSCTRASLGPSQANLHYRWTGMRGRRCSAAALASRKTWDGTPSHSRSNYFLTFSVILVTLASRVDFAPANSRPCFVGKTGTEDRRRRGPPDHHQHRANHLEAPRRGSPKILLRL